MRNAKVAFVALLATLTASAAASFAQTEDRGQNPPGIFDTPRCPLITVSGPDAPGPDGSLTFTANVSGGDPNVTPTFRWKVSAGEIKGGQGTYTITVEASNALGQFVTATLDVGGYERNQRSCPMSTSCTIGPGNPPVSRKTDEYGDITVGDEKARLNNLVTELQNDPTAQGYLICYGGRRGREGAARRRCERAKNHLGFRGIDAPRVVAVDGGFREELTVELWVVPPGAVPPPSSPTVDPTEVRSARPPRQSRGPARR